MNFEFKRDVNIDGKGGLHAHLIYVCVVVAHSRPCEGGENFHVKPRQSIEPERTLDRTCLIGYTGLGPLPFYVYVVCICVDHKVVKPPHPRACSPLASR